MRPGVDITNLRQFRADLRRAEGALPRALTRAIKAAGVPVQKRASALARVGTARSSGRLAAGYTIRASGTTGTVVNREPYAAGAEWGSHGKWSGFGRYGARGERFAGRAVAEEPVVEEVATLIEKGLTEIISLEGWAR